MFASKLGCFLVKSLSLMFINLQFSLIKISNIKKILEIGSFTGFSALSMALVLPFDGVLISLDKSSEFSMKAQSFYEKANEKKIKQIIKPAIESLKDLKNSSQKFDLIFIDADKENYPHYFDLIIDKLETGGVILSDNVLWSGKVLEKANDEATSALQEYNHKINSDARVETIILPIRDGLTITRKR